MFRFLGAGEYIATLSDNGHWYLPLIAVIIAIMLAGFGIYALVPLAWGFVLYPTLN